MKNKPYALSLIALFTFLCIFRIFSLGDPYFVESEDSANYILLGKSLANGLGYKTLWTQNVEPYVKAPPGLPLLLAAMIKIFGYNLSVLTVVPLIISIGVLLIIFPFFNEISNRSVAAYVLVLTCLSYYFFSFSCLILTEMPYMFFSLTAMLYIQKADKRKFFYNKYLIIAAFFILAAYFTRVIGLTLILALIAYIFFDKNPNKKRGKYFANKLLLSFFLIMPVLLWEIRNINLMEGQGETYYQEIVRYSQYVKQLSGGEYIVKVLKPIYANIFYVIPGVLTGIKFSSRSFFAFLLSVVVLTGFTRSFIKKRTFIVYYMAFYLLACFLSPWTKIRYMVSIIPVIFYFFIIGVQVIISASQKYLNIKTSLANYAVAFIIFIVMLINAKGLHAVGTGRTYLYGYEYGDVSDFLSMAKWVKENTDPSSILTGPQSALSYLYLDRKAILLPDLDRKAILLPEINFEDLFFREYDDNNHYIVISPVFSFSCFKHHKSIITKSPDKVTEIYRKNKSAVYKVNNPRWNI